MTLDSVKSIFGLWRCERNIPRNRGTEMYLPSSLYQIIISTFGVGCTVEDIFGPDGTMMNAIAVVTSRDAGDQQVSVLIVQCVRPGEEKSMETLQIVTQLMKDYNCPNGLILSYENATVFCKVEGANEEVSEKRQITLDRNGVKELEEYWASIKPGFILEKEERYRNRYTDQQRKTIAGNSAPWRGLFGLGANAFMRRIWVRQESNNRKGRIPRPFIMDEVLGTVSRAALNGEELSKLILNSIAVITQESGKPRRASLVVKFVYPSQQKTDKAAGWISDLMETYNCDHGFLLSFETGLIFHREQNTEGNDQINKIKEVELNFRGIRQLENYWYGIRPRSVSEAEEAYKQYILREKSRRGQLRPARSLSLASPLQGLGLQ